MLIAKPKSALQEKLRDAQLRAAYIVTLEGLRSEMYCAKLNQGSEHVEWYGAQQDAAIGAGIKALAESIDSEIDDVHELISEAAGVAQ
jgi:hypothetical protein